VSYLLSMWRPVWRRRDSHSGFRTELENLSGDGGIAPDACLLQAPHSAMPQPNLVPVMPSTSRSTHNSGVSPSTSTLRSSRSRASTRCDLDGVGAVGFENPHRPGGPDPVAMQEDHDLPHRLLLGPGGRNPTRTHRPDAVNLPQPVGISLDDIEDPFAERADQFLRVARSDAPDHAGGEIALNAVDRGGPRRLQEPGTELLTVGAVVDPLAGRGDPLPGGEAVHRRLRGIRGGDDSYFQIRCGSGAQGAVHASGAGGLRAVPRQGAMQCLSSRGRPWRRSAIQRFYRKQYRNPRKSDASLLRRATTRRTRLCRQPGRIIVCRPWRCWFSYH
jgi:hypothetical protein